MLWSCAPATWTSWALGPLAHLWLHGAEGAGFKRTTQSTMNITYTNNIFVYTQMNIMPFYSITLNEPFIEFLLQPEFEAAP